MRQPLTYHAGFPSAGSYHTFITAAYCLCDALCSTVCPLCRFSHEWREWLTTFHLSRWPTLPPHLSLSKWTQNWSASYRIIAEKIECCVWLKSYWNEMKHIFISCPELCSNFGRIGPLKCHPSQLHVSESIARLLCAEILHAETNMKKDSFSYLHFGFSTMPLRLACPLAISVLLIKIYITYGNVLYFSERCHFKGGIIMR